MLAARKELERYDQIMYKAEEKKMALDETKEMGERERKLSKPQPPL